MFALTLLLWHVEIKHIPLLTDGIFYVSVCNIESTIISLQQTMSVSVNKEKLNYRKSTCPFTCTAEKNITEMT